MALGVTVLASLRCGNVHNLAGTSLDHNVTVFADGTGLHGERLGCPSVGRLKVHIMVFLIRHDDWLDKGESSAKKNNRASVRIFQVIDITFIVRHMHWEKAAKLSKSDAQCVVQTF